MAVRRSGDASISLIVATARRFNSFTMSWSSLAISASAEAWFLAGEEAGCLPEVDDEVGFAAFFGTGLLAIQPASTETIRTDASLQNFNRFHLHERLPPASTSKLRKLFYWQDFVFASGPPCSMRLELLRVESCAISLHKSLPFWLRGRWLTMNQLATIWQCRGKPSGAFE